MPNNISSAHRRFLNNIIVPNWNKNTKKYLYNTLFHKLSNIERVSLVRIVWTIINYIYIYINLRDFFLLLLFPRNLSKLYRSYYPHRSRELVSPVCGIFLPVNCFSFLITKKQKQKTGHGLRITDSQRDKKKKIFFYIYHQTSCIRITKHPRTFIMQQLYSVVVRWQVTHKIFFSFGAIVRTYWEVECFPYACFLLRLKLSLTPVTFIF